MNKKESAAFTDELQMKGAIMMPIYTFDTIVMIGYVCFFFQTDREIEMDKLERLKTSF